jgi:hypothetical protein
MRQHPLDREMGLAGIGRPEHGGYAGAGGALIGERGSGIGKGHFYWVSASLLFWKMSHNATLCGRGLSSGTVKERIAPESLTPMLSGFVHRNMSHE